MFYKICDMPQNEKPRERLIEYGAASLSDSELLAIILRSGGKNDSALILARNLLIRFGGLKGLHEVSFEKLRDVRYVGIAKATSLMALCELSLRMHSGEPKRNRHIKRPKDIYELTKKRIYNKKNELLLLVSLNSRNRVISVDTISIGSVSSAMIDVREVFRQAFERNAVSIVLVHNHPSGDITPSSEDIILTETIAQASKILNIPLLDHVIVTNEEYVSMKAMNLFDVAKFNN